MRAFIVIRAFVFYRNEQGEWLVNAKGFKHDFNQARNIDSIFSAVENGSFIKTDHEIYQRRRTLQ